MRKASVLLHSPLEFGYVLEVHRESIARRVDSPSYPCAEDRADGLELGGSTLLHRSLYLPIRLGADRLWELLPDVLAHKLIPRAAPKLLRFAVDIGEAPPPIDGVEGVVDSFECIGGPLPGRLLLGQQAFAFFSLLAYDYVPGHLREAAEVILLIPQGGNQHAGPEVRTVLAYPYSFLLVLAL